LNRFLTLTLDPKKLPADQDPVTYIRDVWRKFRVYLQRQHGKTIPFIAVLEAHKSRIPHLHVLVDRFIAQSWVSKAWSSLGGGQIVYIERVKDLGAMGWYLGKYLTKDMLMFGKRGQRRFTTSRGIRIGATEKAEGWSRAPARMVELRRAAGEKALEVVEDESGGVRYFETERPLRRMKAFGNRLMFGPSERGGDDAKKQAQAEAEGVGLGSRGDRDDADE
jgi:hypothetical protein